MCVVGVSCDAVGSSRGCLHRLPTAQQTQVHSHIVYIGSYTDNPSRLTTVDAVCGVVRPNLVIRTGARVHRVRPS